MPLLLVELVRGLKRAGVIRRHPRGESWFLATDELDHLPDLPLIEWLAQLVRIPSVTCDEAPAQSFVMQSLLDEDLPIDVRHVL